MFILHWNQFQSMAGCTELDTHWYAKFAALAKAESVRKQISEIMKKFICFEALFFPENCFWMNEKLHRNALFFALRF